MSWIGCPATPPWALMYLTVASNAGASSMSAGPAFVSRYPILIGVPLAVARCAAPADPVGKMNAAPNSVSTHEHAHDPCPTDPR